MKYIHIVLIIYRPASNLLSSYVNEPKFWIYICVLQKTTMSQQLPKKEIFIGNFADLKRNLYSGL